MNTLGKCIIRAWSQCKQEERSHWTQDEEIFSISPCSVSATPITPSLAYRCVAGYNPARDRRVSREVWWGVPEQKRLLWMKPQPQQQLQSFIRYKCKIKAHPPKRDAVCGHCEMTIQEFFLCARKGISYVFWINYQSKHTSKIKSSSPKSMTDVAAHSCLHCSMLFT